MKNKVLLLSLLLFAITGISFAQTYYVDPSGTDNVLNGTAAGTNAFKTITFAVAAATTPGATINVAAGTYTENITLPVAVTLVGASASSVTVTAASSSVSVFTITSSSVAISGFAITGATTGSQTAGILANGGLTGCSIHNNKITGNLNGIYLQSGGTTFGTVFDNDIMGNTSYGVYNVGSQIVDAHNNYWGSASGPYQSTTNTLGTGDRVSDLVTYLPWYTDATHTPTASFNLITPVNGLTGVSVLPTFDWPVSTDETGYLLELSTSVGFGSVLYTKTLGAVTEWASTAAETGVPLNNGTLYYWRVTTIGETGGPRVSAISHFTTVPASVSLNNPVNGTVVYGSPTTFAWDMGGSTAGIQFILQYKYSATGGPSGPEDEAFWNGGALVTMSPTTGTTINASPALILGKTYYWRVLAQRTAGPNEYVYYPQADVCNNFTTAGGATFVTVYPSWPVGNATVFTNQPTLNWYLDDYSVGLSYNVKYVQANINLTCNSSGGVLLTGTEGETVITVNQVNGGSDQVSYQTPVLLPGTTYYWQVQAYYSVALNSSAWSTISSYVTNGSGTLHTPVPSYPTDGVSIYTTDPTLYWYLATAGTGLWYDVRISTTANMGSLITGYNPFFTTVTPDVLSLDVSALVPGQGYYWQVRSRNSSGPSPTWSSTAAFSVQSGAGTSSTVVAYPTLESPPPTVYTTTPTLSWYLEGSGVGITGYRVRYIKSATQPATWADFGGSEVQLASTALTTTAIPSLTFTYGDVVYWAVATYNGGGTLPQYAVGSFTVFGGVGYSNVELSAPTDLSTVYNTSVTLHWYVMGSEAGIDHYNIQYSNSDVFLSATSVTTTGKSYNLSGLISGATYWWKVQSDDGAGHTSAWSTTWSFSVQTGSPNIVQPLIGGPNNITISSVNPTLSWVLPVAVGNGINYEVQYSNNASFLNNTTVSNVNITQTNLSGLTNNAAYFWRVRSKTSNGTYSYFSNTGQFNIGTVTGIKEPGIVPTVFFVNQNYPNPFNPSTTIKYGLPNASIVTIKVYDMLGREVKTLVNEQKNAGTFSVQWNGDNNAGRKVTSGIYLFRVAAGTNIATKKMILLK